MKLKSLGSNMTQVETGKYSVLFSYETPVAAFDSSGKAFKTSQKFSTTTSKHINKFLGSDAKTAEEKPQSFFNTLTESNVSVAIKESLGIEAACGFLDVMGSCKPIMENFDGDEEDSMNEEDETYEELDVPDEDSDMHESNLNESSGGKDWENEDVIDSRDIIERIEELESNEDLDESEQEELAMLKSVAEDGEGYSDWEHGETLINTNYWVEYCMQLVEDIGDLPRDFPSYIEIDWDRTAANLSHDYSRIDVGSSEFYIRN